MNYDNKNFILAIVLSMLIIFGWQYFYAAPLQKKLTTERPPRPRAQGQPARPPARHGGTVPGTTAEAAPANREQALAAVAAPQDRDGLRRRARSTSRAR